MTSSFGIFSLKNFKAVRARGDFCISSKTRRERPGTMVLPVSSSITPNNVCGSRFKLSKFFLRRSFSMKLTNTALLGISCLGKISHQPAFPNLFGSPENQRFPPVPCTFFKDILTVSCTFFKDKPTVSCTFSIRSVICKAAGGFTCHTIYGGRPRRACPGW